MFKASCILITINRHAQLPGVPIREHLFTEFESVRVWKKDSTVQLHKWQTCGVQCLFLKDDLVFEGFTKKKNHTSNECTNLVKWSNNTTNITQKENSLLPYFLKLIHFPKESIEQIWCFLFYNLPNVHFRAHVCVTLGVLMAPDHPLHPCPGILTYVLRCYQTPKEERLCTKDFPWSPRSTFFGTKRPQKTLNIQHHLFQETKPCIISLNTKSYFIKQYNNPQPRVCVSF